ncbi:MAG: hypothetical protein HBSAPP03_13700 [Phycisphaerae bacterium]|nr:MAG: hypothetical protein HBSAPP03_13700 [Phycisphaerae bacterium]
MAGAVMLMMAASPRRLRVNMVSGSWCDSAMAYIEVLHAGRKPAGARRGGFPRRENMPNKSRKVHASRGE